MAIFALTCASASVYLSTWAWARAWIRLTNASAKALVTAWACSGVEPVPVTVSAPDVGSTVPVTWPASAVGDGSWSEVAAASCTPVLDSSCSGSGRVNGEDEDVPLDALGASIWISVLDWYVGVAALA